MSSRRNFNPRGCVSDIVKLQRLIPVAVAAVLLAGFAVAAGHPDISGTWAIDAAKSDFGPNPVPDDLTLQNQGGR